MRVQYFLACTVLVLQSVHNENTEIITDTEYKGRQDDIDDIELNPQDSHQPEDNHPTDQHREKTHQRKFDTSVREPQGKEYQERRKIQNQVEVIIDGGHPFVGKVGTVEDDDIPVFVEMRIYRFLICLANPYLADKHRYGISRCLPFIQ